jgi:plastocyanin
MKRLSAVVIGVALLAGIGFYEPAAAAPKVKVTISNFRFCKADSCSPLDIGYLRTDSGPVMGTDNAQATIDVKRGATVVWTYRDASCDGFMGGCPGHNVVFENGSPTGSRKGFAPANKGAKTISVKITQKAGTMIRYFCSVNNHYQEGMTGILRVTK